MFASGSARAAFTVTIQQVGSAVVATGSGSLNISGLTPADGTAATALTPGGVDARTGNISLGPGGNMDIYTELSNALRFGPGVGGFVAATSGVGDQVNLVAFGDALGVPAGYVSGSPLSDSSAFTNSSFAGLGLTRRQSECLNRHRWG